MPKNLVLCFDGTNNQFGRENTNVVRLVQVLDRTPAIQRLYYDPGVGTLPEPGAWTGVGKSISKVFGLAFGAGIFWKAGEAYQYLMDTWEPGDRVYMFGFSRGAYMARLLAAIVHQVGLLPRFNPNLIPYVMRLFKALPKEHQDDSAQAMDAYFELSEQFRRTFSRVVPDNPHDRHFRVHFLGLWDTVSSVGWAWDPPAYPYTTTNPSVDVIRHAVSINERRWFFRQNLMHQATPAQDLQQIWFPGVHSDVGGGYPAADGGLWRAPFSWLVEAAQNAGLAVDSARLASVLSQTPVSPDSCLDKKHESLTLAWWPAEFFPKLRHRPNSKRKLPAVGAGHYRTIPAGALIGRCALQRLREDANYRPANMSQAFVQRVLDLDSVPSSLPYHPS